LLVKVKSTLTSLAPLWIISSGGGGFHLNRPSDGSSKEDLPAPLEPQMQYAAH